MRDAVMIRLIIEVYAHYNHIGLPFRYHSKLAKSTSSVGFKTKTLHMQLFKSSTIKFQLNSFQCLD